MYIEREIHQTHNPSGVTGISSNSC